MNQHCKKQLKKQELEHIHLRRLEITLDKSLSMIFSNKTYKNLKVSRGFLKNKNHHHLQSLDQIILCFRTMIYLGIFKAKIKTKTFHNQRLMI